MKWLITTIWLVLASPGAMAGEAGAKLAADHLFKLGWLPVTNSMLVCWGVALLLIAMTQLAVRRMRPIPGRWQSFWELLIDGLINFLASIMGEELARRTFWFFGTLFIFILAANWIGLVPGFGVIGWGVHGEHGFEVVRPLLRGANADLNLTLAMATVFFACWLWWSLSTVGLRGFLLHLFGPKGDSKGFLGVVMVIVFLAVGVLEVVSILFRPISLSLRLFGNVFAGETMIETMLTRFPSLSWILPVPLYVMEFAVGLIQAAVFTLLGAVFTMLMCQHDESAAGHRPATPHET